MSSTILKFGGARAADYLAPSCLRRPLPARHNKYHPHQPGRPRVPRATVDNKPAKVRCAHTKSMTPNDLDHARQIAARHVEHSGHEFELRALIYDLCDEIEALRARL